MAFCNLLQCKFWIVKLLYFTLLFQHFNVLNSSIQAKKENILTSIENIKALDLEKNSSASSFEIFPLREREREREREICLFAIKPFQ